MTVTDPNMTLSDTPEPIHVGFLLIDGFALLPYASVVEPLRAANRLSGRRLYRWSHVSPDGAPVMASCDVRFAVQGGPGADSSFDLLLVCAGGNPAQFDHAPTFAWLRQLARRGVVIGGVSGGPYLLARAQLLAGYRVTIHWDHAAALLEDYPDLDLKRSLYEIDRDRLTCAGGIAPLDMMHALIAQAHGPDLAMAVSEWFLQTQVREGAGPQRMPLRARLGITHEPLLRVIGRMEAAIEQPLPLDELARGAGVSPRQFERLFRQHLGCSPGAHYLALRLEHGRKLLRQTSLSVMETALACGFMSASHFSRCYRRRFGQPPRSDRAAG